MDAYPTEDFHGTVSQIRLQPVVVQNVTTYGTIVDVPNNDLKLKPGMTANLKVQIAKRTDVLRVPNAALRFRPTADMFTALSLPVPPEVSGAGRGRGAMAPGQTATATAAGGAQTGGGNQAAGGQAAGGQPSPDQRARLIERFKSMSPDEQQQFLARMKERGVDVSAFQPAAPAKPAAPSKAKAGAPPVAETIDALFAPLPPTESSGRVWVYMDKQLKPVRIRLGITDGQYSELLSGELQPNMELVTGILGVTATKTTTTAAGNPLMGPQRGRGR